MPPAGVGTGLGHICQPEGGWPPPPPRTHMLTAAPACVQDNSLLQMPPWCNPWLLVAAGLSLGLHFVILYVPVLADIFSIVPLSPSEWGLVILFSFPVVVIDEVRLPCTLCRLHKGAAHESLLALPVRQL